jgi:spore coat protein U-like protein
LQTLLFAPGYKKSCSGILLLILWANQLNITKNPMKNDIKRNALKLAMQTAFVMGGAMLGVNAYAADATSSMAVGATVGSTCAISTAPIAFGTYDAVTKAEINATGSVTVTCTLGAATVVKLNQGVNPTGPSTDAVPVRRMNSGANLLPYSLSTEATMATVWENTTGVAHTGTGTATMLTVYGRIAAGVNVPAGTYADTVVATVTF